MHAKLSNLSRSLPTTARNTYLYLTRTTYISITRMTNAHISSKIALY